MTGLEIGLILGGLAIIVVSFIFSTKLDGQVASASDTAELTERQRAAIEKQIVDIFDEKMEVLIAKQQSQMDLIETKSKQDMDAYGETILEEINKNHNEVMFLYDMLNEKKKEINNTVRDINATKAELIRSNSDMVEAVTPVSEAPVKKSRMKSVKEKVLDQLDAVAGAVSSDSPIDLEAEKPKKNSTKSTGKTAASRAKKTVNKESERMISKSPESFETGNNNEKILEMNRAGKTNVEIAKELGIGMGEVKLVLDLFKGGRS